MATSLYVVERSTKVFTKTGSETNLVAEQGMILECDWLWDSGNLKGMRKIVAPQFYAGYYIKDSDLSLYVETPPNTSPILRTTIELPDGSTYEATQFTRIA